MFPAWLPACPFLSATPSAAGTYDLPQGNCILTLDRRVGHDRANYGLSLLSGCARASSNRVRATAGCAHTVRSVRDSDCDYASRSHVSCYCAVAREPRAQILGQSESRTAGRCCCYEWHRLRRNSRQPAERRTGTQSNRPRLRTLLGGPGRELCRRNRGRYRSQLLLSQDRPSQIGARRLRDRHRQLCRRRNLRTAAPLDSSRRFPKTQATTAAIRGKTSGWKLESGYRNTLLCGWYYSAILPCIWRLRGNEKVMKIANN